MNISFSNTDRTSPKRFVVATGISDDLGSAKLLPVN
jgi:hypothetical protein